jgi:hypothetical protein
MKYLSAISTQSKRYITFLLSLSSPFPERFELLFCAFSLIRSVTAISSFASYREERGGREEAEGQRGGRGRDGKRESEWRFS